jgi:hypothetical protein
VKRIRKRDLLARIESIEERLARPVPEPLPGQQTIPTDLLHALHGPHHDAHQPVDKEK